MKLKVVVIDLELSPAWKRWLWSGAAVVSLAGATLAYAAPAHVWNNGDTLTAQHLNAAFADLDSRLAAVDGRVGALDNRVGAIDGRVSTIEANAALSRSAFQAMRSTPQDVPPALDRTLIFDEVFFDDNDEYDPATGVFKPKQAGLYEIGCSWEADIPPATPLSFYAEAGIIIDGTKLYAGLFSDMRQGNRSVRTIAKLDAGSRVTCIAFHDAGTTVRTTAQFDTKFDAIRL